MYKLFMPLLTQNSGSLNAIKILLNNVLGYNHDEIEYLINKRLCCDVAINLSLDEAKNISQIFRDNDVTIYLYDQKSDSPIAWTRDLGIVFTKNPPKDHYCDEPLISRDHLVSPLVERQPERGDFTPVSQPKKPVVECPYCKSTNTKKITVTSKAVHTAIFGLFSLSRNAKQWKCNDCGSEF